MKTYVINLDKDKDRLSYIDTQLKRLSITYERFPAIYAKDLSFNELDSKINRFRFKCCIGRDIKIGEVGCALSHHMLYQKMIDQNIDYMCILEDDIILDNGFSNALTRVEQTIDISKPQVFLLSNYTNDASNTPDIKKIKYGICTDGYILTQKAAAAILKENTPICTPCDHWFRWVKHKKIELYSVNPPVCRQNNELFESNIPSYGEKPMNQMRLYKKILYISNRVMGKTIDNILYYIGR